MSSTNITLAIDEKLVERAREVARQQGTSLNALIRGYIEHLAGQSTGVEVARELERLWRDGSGDSGSRRIRRDDIYEDRVGRTRVR